MMRRRFAALAAAAALLVGGFVWATPTSHAAGPVTSVTLDTSSSTITIQTGTFQINPTVLPTDADDPSLTWTSSDETVATVDGTGLVTLLALGSTTITATANDGSGLSATATVEVTANSIAVSPKTASVAVGATTQLAATVDPSGTALTWTSSDETVATVDSTGLVTGVGVGSATITVIGPDGVGPNDSAAVTVTPAVVPVTGITVALDNASTIVGGTAMATATVAPDDATNPAYTWSSDTPAVATVDATGKVTAVALGTANIIATSTDDSTITGSAAFTVAPPAATLQFQVNGDRVAEGVIGAPTGATFTLTDASGSPVSTQFWATCTVDATGLCTFPIPDGGIPTYADYYATLSSAGWTQATSPDIYVWDLDGTLTADSPIVLERANPPLPATCGLGGVNVALVADLSSSMDGVGLDTLKADFQAYVNSLVGTNSSVALFTFGETAPADDGVNQNRPLTSVATAAGAAQVNSWIDGWTAPGFSTNWDAGLFQVANSGIAFNLVIFISDGQPNISSSGAYDTLPDNVASANALKAMGTRVLTVFAGSSSSDSTMNLTSVSGPTTGNPNAAVNDYFVSDWANVGGVLSALASACPGAPVPPAPAQPVSAITAGTGGSVSGALPFGGAILLVVLGGGVALTRKLAVR